MRPAIEMELRIGPQTNNGKCCKTLPNKGIFALDYSNSRAKKEYNKCYEYAKGVNVN